MNPDEIDVMKLTPEDELFNIGRNEILSDDEIRKRMENLQNEIAQLRKENCRVYDQRNQLADEK